MPGCWGAQLHPAPRHYEHHCCWPPYLQCHSPDKALELFETMKAGGVQPDVVTYASLLTALQGPPAQPAAARQVGAPAHATAWGAACNSPQSWLMGPHRYGPGSQRACTCAYL